MISTLAPVALSKSGARRCRGSAIWGPVNVTTRIVVPLNWAFDVGVLELQATNKPTVRTRALARYRLITSVLLQKPEDPVAQTPEPRGPLPPIIRMFNSSSGICQAPNCSNRILWSLVIRCLASGRGLGHGARGRSGVYPGVEAEPFENALEDPAEDRHGHERDDQRGSSCRPVQLTLECEEIHHRHRDRLDLAGREHQRHEQQIPGEHEKYDRGRSDSRCNQREHDLSEHAQQASPIEHSCFLPICR